MMIQEFTARTGYIPEAKEYHYIEESYYEFEGQKDEFCKWWKKAYKSGEWKKEMRLREALDIQKDEYEELLKEKEDTISWYTERFEEHSKARKEILQSMRDMQELVRMTF